MRIFLGTVDTATCLSGLGAGFEALGHQVTRMVVEAHPFYAERRYEIVRGMPILARYDYLRSSSRVVRGLAARTDVGLGFLHNAVHTWDYLQNHDVFLFISRPWLPEWVLFPLLKRLGKKVIYYCLGSDVRHISAFHQEYQGDAKMWERLFHNDNLNKKIEKLRAIELHCDVVYSVPDQAGLAIRPYNHVLIPLQHTMNVRPHIPARDVPIVVHAPSRTGIKGTSLFLEAVERLRREGVKFEFRLLQGVPNEKLLDVLCDADIVADEVLLHGPGMLSHEGMAAGCAVATRYLTEHRAVFDPPICPILPETIAPQLKRLILDKPYRMELAANGPAYVRTHNAPARVAATILADLEEPRRPDYTPDFYMRHYVLPERVRLHRGNMRSSAEVARIYGNFDAAVWRSAADRGLVERSD